MLKQTIGMVNTNGKKQKMGIAVHSDDDQATVDNFAKMVQKDCTGRESRIWRTARL
jgi:hypothetical protein